ncbi:hypothetical protein BD779DRAFT_1478889 [Infundibulicybe gibba]|nr:hypothetical protein BD779DRAFT_1478889 [Infundibulicybe gibba]
MFFKALSLCALALSGVACAAAQDISPGRYTMGSSIVFASNRGAQLRGPGQNLIIPGSAPIPVIRDSDRWDFTPGQGGGFIMRNVAFGNFLKVDSNDVCGSRYAVTHPGTLVTTGTQDQATSFAVTPLGSSEYHVNVAGQDRLWAIPIDQDGPFPTPDDPVSIQPANGGPEQIWRFTRLG